MEIAQFPIKSCGKKTLFGRQALKIISVNVGQPSKLMSRGREVTTGIRKSPVSDPVYVSNVGITGDRVLNAKHHGGPDQAVYGYRIEDYRWWTKELGYPVERCAFGENLTFEGLGSAALPIGSRLHFEQVVLEVTSPRIPCQTLNAVMQNNQFSKLFAREARSGFYFRVINEGELSAGENFELEYLNDSAPSTVDLFHANYRNLNRAELENFIAWPIDTRTRRKFQRQLERII